MQGEEEQEVEEEEGVLDWEEVVEEAGAEALRMGVEGVEVVLGEEGVWLVPGQDLAGVEEGVEVQVVPRQCPAGLESRPAERLPASLAQEQRSLPAQSLEESPQRQGQRHLISSALAPTPAAPSLAAPAALVPAVPGPVSPASPALVSPAPGDPGVPAPVSPAPAAPAPAALSPAFPFLTSPSPSSPSPFFLSPAFPAPAPFVVAALVVAFFEFPILLVMGHSELGQVVVNFV